MNEASRSTSISSPVEPWFSDYLNPNPGQVTSPSWKGPGWYKFSNPAGTQIANSLVPMYRCGTARTGYMVDSHPTEVGQTKNVKFCWVLAQNPCYWDGKGEVTKCGEGDFVYKLPDSRPYNARYCAVP